MPPTMIRTALSEPRSTVEAARGQPRAGHRDRRPPTATTPISSPATSRSTSFAADTVPRRGTDRNVGVAVRCRYSPVIPMTPSTAAISTAKPIAAVEQRLDRHPAVRRSC